MSLIMLNVIMPSVSLMHVIMMNINMLSLVMPYSTVRPKV